MVTSRAADTTPRRVLRLVAFWSALTYLACAPTACREKLPFEGARDAGAESRADGGQLQSDGNVTAPDASVDVFTGPVTLDDDAVAHLEASTLFAGRAPCRPPLLVRVTHVADGDTVTVQHDDGTSERIRMIGVNTPEIAHSAAEVDECFGRDAKRFTEQLYGHLVWLTFDALCTDPYDRTLAFVHYGADTSAIWERQLLQRGLGRAFIIGRNRALEALATSDEAAAHSAARGLWGSCPPP